METFAIGFQKWFDHEWINFGVFCSEMAPFIDFISVRTEICKKCSIVNRFWWHQIFGCLVWRVFWSVLHKRFYFFAVGFCNIDWLVLALQCNLTFYLFVSSSLLYLEVVVNVFDYFWKPNMLFSSFVLTAFWCTTPCTVLIVLWKMFVEPVNAHALRWACACPECVSGLWILEKTLNFPRCIHIIDLVLKYGSDINEGKWLQLLFYFIVLISMAVFVSGMSFFSPVFQVLDWSFLVLHFDGNVCKWIPKVIWPWMD